MADASLWGCTDCSQVFWEKAYQGSPTYPDDDCPECGGNLVRLGDVSR